MWFAISFIAFCVFLCVAVLKFESVQVTHYVKVTVSARKILDAVKNLLQRKINHEEHEGNQTRINTD